MQIDQKNEERRSQETYTLFFFYKNTLYKNIEAQILDLEILKLNFFGKCLC